LSAGILIIFGGVTDRLIPLFAVGAFLAFTLSQAGMVAHWAKAGGARHAGKIAINGIGALATGATLVVILIAKFAEGAWVMTLLIPTLLAIFGGVRRHYHRVSVEIANPYALNVENIKPPIVILPMKAWNKMSQKGLRFALKLSPDVKPQHPDRQIAVLIPELIARHWYERLLHNKRAAMLKALLLVRGDEDIAVINVPWYLSD